MKSGLKERIYRAWAVLRNGHDWRHVCYLRLLDKSEQELYRANLYIDALIQAAAKTSIRHRKELEQGHPEPCPVIDPTRPMTETEVFWPGSDDAAR